jgi:hypothetical protein
VRRRAGRTPADGASTVAAGSTSDAVKVDGSTITISAAGTYRLSGSLSDGQVVVAAGEEDVVRIILDGADLNSSTGLPFVVQSANEAIVYLAEGSMSTVADAASYAGQGTDSTNAALYYMADLTIAGSGALTGNGRYNDGIVSKDDLVLAAGSVSVDAADNGIRGSGATITFGTAVPAGTTIQLADSSGQVAATFVTAKQTASLVFSSAAITAGEEYTVYTGGTAHVTAGVGKGSLDRAHQQGTVTAGEYTAARGPGGRR